MERYGMEDPSAEQFYVQNLRKMSMERKLRTVFELNHMIMEICKAGIINQNPGISEEELKKEFRRRLDYDSGRNIRKSYR